MTKPNILCIDDEVHNLEAITRLLRPKYNVLSAPSGNEGLEILKSFTEPISVIISDQRMPGLSGVEVLSQSIALSPDSVRILLTGYTDLESAIEAINRGEIYRYVGKPWEPLEFIWTVDQAVEKYRLQKELKLTNLNLEKANKELRTLDQAKNQFMVLVNHELKTPLTSIISFLELLGETELTEEQRLYWSRIGTSSERLKNLIEDILIIVSSETNQLRVNQSAFEIAELKSDLETLMTDMLRKKNHTLQIHDFDKRILGDQRLIRSCLLRLLQNACKFGFEASKIEVRLTSNKPHKVKLEVINSGPQIRAKVIDKILRPFFLDEDVMNHTMGVGLGLTICQSILKAHKSELKIENGEQKVIVSFELSCI